MSTKTNTSSVGDIAAMLELCKLHGVVPAQLTAGDCLLVLHAPQPAQIAGLTVSKSDGARLFERFGGALMNEKPNDDAVTEDDD